MFKSKMKYLDELHRKPTIRGLKLNSVYNAQHDKYKNLIIKAH